MEYDFFQKHFQSQHIETCVPNEPERQKLDRIIWKELSHGLVNPESRIAAIAMIRNLASQGVEAVVLGCTELCLLIKPEDTHLPLYDTTRIHAEAILKYALDDAQI
jgi:aspartate racemase